MFFYLFVFIMFTMFIYITNIIPFIMKKQIIKTLIISFLCFILNSCRSNKLTPNDKNQEYYKEKRQEAFDELYNEHH